MSVLLLLSAKRRREIDREGKEGERERKGREKRVQAVAA
jgi:hypothetical protein